MGFQSTSFATSALVLFFVTLALHAAADSCNDPIDCSESDEEFCAEVGTCPLVSDWVVQVKMSFKNNVLKVYEQGTETITGFQFTALCADTEPKVPLNITKLHNGGGIAESKGFQTNWNSTTGKAISFSLELDEIPPSPKFKLFMALEVESECTKAVIEDVFVTNEELVLVKVCGGHDRPCPLVNVSIPDYVTDICTEAGLSITSLEAEGVTEFQGTAEPECIVGTAGSDTILGGGGNDIIFGLNGRDYISGQEGSDTLYGNDKGDILMGDSGRDLLYGGNGNDLLDGGPGSDFLAANKGADTLIGGPANDTIRAGIGSDVIIGCFKEDIIQQKGPGDVVQCFVNF